MLESTPLSPVEPETRPATTFAFVHRLGTRLTLLIVSFVLLLALVTFGVITVGFQESGQNATAVAVGSLETQARQSLLEIVEREARLSDAELGQAATTSRTAATYLQARLEEATAPTLPALTQGPQGQWFDARATRQSNVWIPNHTPNDTVRRDLRDSAVLDPLFPALLAQVPNAVAVYFVNPRGAFRYYPVSDLHTILPADLNVATQMIFTWAAPEANPERRTVWSTPYRDDAGHGFLVTVSTPVYVRGAFRGIIAVDVSLSRLASRLEALKTTPGGFAFLIDDDRRLIAAPPDALSALLSQEVSTAAEGAFGTDLSEVKGDVGTALAAMRRGETGLHPINLGAQATLLAYAPLPSLGWSLALAVPHAEITAPAAEVAGVIARDARGTTQRIVIIMSSFFLLALVFATAFNRRFLLRPIEALAEGTRQLAVGNLGVILPVNSRDELGALARAFNDMSGRLASSRQSLQEGSEALRASEERYALAMHGANDGLWDWDIVQNALYFSPRWKAIQGYSKDELENRFETWRDLIHPDDRDEVMRKLEVYLSCQDLHYALEHRLRHKDGSYRWILSRGAALRDESGKAYRLAGSHTDITERKRAEAELGESQRALATLMSNLPGMAYRCRNELDWPMVFVSEGCLELTGYRDSELVGHAVSYASLIHHDDREGVWHEVQAALQARRPFQCVYRITTAAGAGKWVWERGQGIYTAEGELTALEGFVTDISERVEAAQLLEARVEERTHALETLLNVSQSLSSTLELSPLLHTILLEFRKLVPYGAAGVLSFDAERDELVLVEYEGPAAREGLRDARFPLASDPMWQALGRGETVVIADLWGDSPEAENYRAHAGDEVLSRASQNGFQSWMGVPIFLGERFLGALLLQHAERDYFTSERRRLAAAFAAQAAVAIENARLFALSQDKAALEERQKLARELHDSVSQALYGIALGTKTAQALLERNPKGVKEPLNYISNLAEAGLAEMRALIFELRPESLEQEGLVVAITKQAASLRARHGLKVALSLGEEPSLALAAKQALYRIVQESLHNIVKHADATKVIVNLSRDDACVTLKITDNGVGFQTGGDFPGHLGLKSMCERAEALGGTCTVESAPNEGTRIEVTLPTSTS